MDMDRVSKEDLLIFGKRIKMLRQKHDVTQMDLAKAVGYTSTGTISQIENGQRGVSFKRIPRFANFFGISKAELLSEKEFSREAAMAARLLERLSVNKRNKLMLVIKKEYESKE